MILFVIFLALVLVHLLALLVLAFFIIQPVSSCPACFAEITVPVRRPLIRLLGRHYEWRWCPACGWEALVSKQSASDLRATTHVI
jgi:hypothetical protein